MMEKLLAMRLQGVVEGLKAQEQDRAINELSFLERLSLLVDQQWSWRENQALARRLKAAKLRGPACVEDIDYRAARGLDKTVVRALAKDSAWVRNHENIFVLRPTGVGAFPNHIGSGRTCSSIHSLPWEVSGQNKKTVPSLRTITSGVIGTRSIAGLYRYKLSGRTLLKSAMLKC